ncbi:hypothetical protein AGMMS50268_03420 [Spirochaetia bacterium]|nr:hypothetical protein AGMMS50268_03420 [Spirochaetia bacterium]
MVFAEELSGVSLSFYQGLLAKDAASAAAFFESALESPNPFIRDAAAEQLILPLLNSEIPPDTLLKLPGSQPAPGLVKGSAETSLGAAVFYTQGRYGDIEKLYAGEASPDGKKPPWDTALLLLAETRLRPGETREKIRSFLFSSVPGDALLWALEEIRRFNPEALRGAENAAIDGRLAAARSAFSGGLILFRLVLEQEPSLFFRYPELLTDLGRCLQFASGGNEGVEILQNMDRQLQSGDEKASVTFSPEALGAIRYRLNYFAGRISRQRKQYRQSREFFTRAIPFAPDSLQSDACIWYILDTALTEGIGESVVLVKSYIPRWHDDPYFSDILDRLSRYLAANRQWQAIADILHFIRNGSDRESVAKYAYITGRALMLGYIPADTDRTEAALPCFRLAYEAGEASYYYRALSASFLGEPLLSLPENTEAGAAAAGKTRAAKTGAAAFPHPAEMAFLLGFFQNGAAIQINPYLQKMKEELSIPELRALAEALHDAELYPELLRLVKDYMGREGYELNRRDLELYYPRPFRELVEKNARAALNPTGAAVNPTGPVALSPELLFGLIRTESAFQADIISRAGAVGLTQLMPATAMEMAGRIRRQNGPDYAEKGAPDLQDPETNIHIGAVYLSYLMNRLEHPLLAILAYNGGMTRVRRWYAASGSLASDRVAGPLPGDIFLETIEYAETREYGRRVLSAAAAYGYLFYDMSLEQLFTDICK